MDIPGTLRVLLLHLAVVCLGTLLSASPANAESGEINDAEIYKALIQSGVPPEIARKAMADGEGALLAAMIGVVTVHDIAIIVGVLPFPTASYIAEVTEFSSNLGLKAFPPRLFAPDDRSVDPAAGDGPGYTADGCGIEFRLLSPQAGYSNLFGIGNIGDPFTEFNPFRFYRFRNYSDPEDPDTRWGFLRAPRLYHANSSVGLGLYTHAPVRRYDPLTDTLSEPYLPIDSAAESPQMVYLPIGQHSIEWRATTQIEVLGDIAVPVVMMAFNVLSELKNAYSGSKAAKVAKAQGFGAGVADEALDPAGAKRLSDGILKFEDVWMKAFEARKATKPTAWQKIVRKIRDNLRGIIRDLVKEALKNTLKELAKAGINSIDGDTKYAIQLVVGNKVADVVEDAWEVYKEKYGQPDYVTKPTSGGNYSVSTQFMIDTLDAHAIPIIRKTLTKRGSGALKALLTIETASSSKVQVISVYDNTPPTIAFDPAPEIIEATDFGGTRTSRSYARLLELAQAATSDNCGRTPELILGAPDFLELGPAQITWTARDLGPNPPGSPLDFSPSATLNIIVQDTQPPLMLVPPSKVILETVDVDLDTADIGDAVAIDLVDVQPTITNDAPAVFPVNARTTVTWVATDGSGNATPPATQLITVKDSNTAPTAADAMASTLTSEPVNILLQGNDVDELDGRFDPLWFKIESQPARGEFVAPLYPFFIQDYRTRPGDGLGENYDPQVPVETYIRSTYCDTSLPSSERIPPRGFVHDARYVHVTDDGIRYVLDEFFTCDASSDTVLTFPRFSQWGPRGDFQGQVRLGSAPEDYPADDAFRVDRDGFLYYHTLLNTGASTELFLHQCPLGFQGRDDLDASTLCNRPPFVGYKFEGSSTPNGEIDPASMRYARVDSDRDVAYVVDASSIAAFELLDSGGVRLVGELGPKDDQGNILADWIGNITSLEVGADGALYANDMQWHRVHKIAPPTVDGQGAFVPGDYVGWAGKCTGSGNNSCTVDAAAPQLGHSRGYSCTFDANSCTVAAADRAGAEQGQFNSPRYIAIDPNDVLYVADYENARIQRFSTDGSFAGEAVSDGSGINKGDRPSFVLGNMGNPASVAVNSSQFFVIDRDEQFVHIFGTLPFKDVTDNSAVVTYVSDQDFPNPDVLANDSFTFSVSDGLDESAPATVTVAVSRNYRPPEAIEETIDAVEDESVDFSLPASDPDGIIGKDFLGLDTLTYKLTRWPEHGTLSGYGEDWTYTPHPDFYGEDSLRFMVNDGVFDSNEGTLTFSVAPVNDPPAVAIDPPGRAALGFPLQVTTVFTDDRIDEISEEVPGSFTDSYEGGVDWGDGTSDVTGGYTNTDGDISSDGVIVVAPATDDTEGRTFAEHTFEQEGEHTILSCVTDPAGEQACDTVTVTVEPLVSLGVAGIFYDAPLPEDEPTLQEIPDATPFTVEVTMTNGAPSVGAGLPAEGVVLDVGLPEGLAVANVAIEQGSCTRSGFEIACDVGTLAPDAVVKLTLTAAGPGTLIYDEDREFAATLATTSDAVEPELGMFATVTLVADTTDTDGDGMSDKFEIAYGLNPAVNDAAGDADGDGLSNGDEYATGSSPREADTDGDGIDDGTEINAGTNPLIDDIGPELVIPPDIVVNATGVLTSVNLGTASAVDFKDGAVTVEPNNPGPFRSGPNVVTWRATDASGNQSEGYQFVDVVPMVNLQVDQVVAEGTAAKVHVELLGPAITYPVTVPYTVTGTAVNPDDHDAASGEAVILSGLSTDIEVAIAKDAVDEPDETVVVTMGTPVNAVAGGHTSHVLTVSETNRPPKVAIEVEQQGRRSTTIVSDAGLIAMIAEVRDDPAQDHAFDWSASDPALVDPVAVNDPAYLLDPSGLGAGMYDTRVSVADNGVPPLATDASSLLRVENEALILMSGDDSDGDGLNDVAEGPDDSDGDRIANYLDDIVHTNLLRLAADNRMLETSPGLTLRLGATAFGLGSVLAALAETDFAVDVDYGYGSGVADFEVAGLDPGATTRVVMPLANPVSNGAGLRSFVNGQWQAFAVDAVDTVASAPGAGGACPPPGNAAYVAGLNAGHGCLQLTLGDGGANDLDGIADGVVRITAGLAAPVSASLGDLPQPQAVFAGDDDYVVARTRVHSDSGDALLNSLTVQASGRSHDGNIDDVLLVHDANRDGEWDADDTVLATGKYPGNDAQLTLVLDSPLELAVGDTDLLVVYVFGPLLLE